MRDRPITYVYVRLAHMQDIQLRHKFTYMRNKVDYIRIRHPFACMTDSITYVMESYMRDIVNFMLYVRLIHMRDKVYVTNSNTRQTQLHTVRICQTHSRA